MSNQTKHFEDAVAATPEVSGYFKSGLMALEGKDRTENLISYDNSRKIQGSLNLEQATKKYNHPYPSRWDYVIEYDNKIYYYEPHPASGGDKIREVIGKIDWLKWWLRDRAPEIRALPTAGFYWIHTGKCDVDKNSRQFKRLTDKGVQLKSKLNM